MRSFGQGIDESFLQFGFHRLELLDQTLGPE